MHGHFAAADPLADDGSSRAPGGHDDEHQPAGDQWEPAAGRDLQEVGAEEREVDGEEGDTEPHGRGPPPPEALAQDHVEQQCGDDHRRRHGDAVGSGEVGRGPETEDEADAGHHQRPVQHRA